jgi:hypothetical protein
MILTWRENLQLTKPRKLMQETQSTETCTNYYAGLEDGIQYKPRRHTTHRELYRENMARTNGINNLNIKDRILYKGDNS